MKYEISFIIFITTLLSGLIYLWVGRKSPSNNVKLLLAFSGGFLFAVSVTDLIPEAYEMAGLHAGMWILAGFYVQYLLDYFSQGLEHGHVHHHGHHEHDEHETSGKTPWVIFTGLCIHALLEGLPIGISETSESTSNALATGIIVHNLPISIALVSMLRHRNTSFSGIFYLLLGFSLMTPAGILLSAYLSNELLYGIASLSKVTTAFVIGIFLHISTTILFESTVNHRFNLQKVLIILAGSIAAILLHWVH
jgi:zinc and cadmium transporter